MHLGNISLLPKIGHKSTSIDFMPCINEFCLEKRNNRAIVVIYHSKIAPTEHLRLTGMMLVHVYVRTYARVPHWRKLVTPYLVVELSPRAEIWCMYATSSNDDVQILTFRVLTTFSIFIWGFRCFKVLQRSTHAWLDCVRVYARACVRHAGKYCSLHISW